jgi:hypothetical protein
MAARCFNLVPNGGKIINFAPNGWRRNALMLCQMAGAMLNLSTQWWRNVLDFCPMGVRCFSFAPDGSAMLWISA